MMTWKAKKGKCEFLQVQPDGEVNTTQQVQGENNEEAITGTDNNASPVVNEQKSKNPLNLVAKYMWFQTFLPEQMYS